MIDQARALLGSPWQETIATAVRLAGIDESAYCPRRLASILLAETLPSGTSLGSTLNGNGTPIQLVVSSGDHPLRVIVDAGTRADSRSVQLDVSLRITHQLLGIIGATSSGRDLDALIDTILPQDDFGLNDLSPGTIWVSGGYSPKEFDRVSVYANGFWGADPRERWLRLVRLLVRLNLRRAAKDLRRLVPALVNRVEPAGAAMDFAASGPTGVKLYFRTVTGSGLAVVGDIAGEGAAAWYPRFRQIAERFFEHGDFPKGTYIGLSFGQSGLQGFKIDICAHCTRLDEYELFTRWAAFVSDLGGNEIYARVARRVLNDRATPFQHANLGFGVAADGSRIRHNVYFCPSLPREPGRVGATAAARLGSALRALIGRQCDDGAWREFSLPVGVSDAWVTAVAGRAVLEGAKMLGSPLARAAAERAADWLRAHEHPSGGWGYNASTPIDSDSTAHVALFLLEFPGADRAGILAILRQFQCASGGFATFRDADGSGAWIEPCPDVTAVAGLAVARLGDPEAGQAAIEYCLDMLAADQGARSYWWDSEHYTSAMLAMLLSWFSRELPNPCNTRQGDPFETALEILRDSAGDTVETRKITRLLDMQQHDGMWPATRHLCIVDPACRQPWAEPRQYDRLFTDDHQIFTTALCALAISNALRLLE